MIRIFIFTLLFPITTFSAELGTNFFSSSAGISSQDLTVNGTRYSGDLFSYGIYYNHNLLPSEKKLGFDLSGSCGYSEGDLEFLDTKTFAYGFGITPFWDLGNTSLYSFANFSWSKTDYVNSNSNAEYSIEENLRVTGIGIQSVSNKLIFDTSLAFPENAKEFGVVMTYKLEENYNIFLGLNAYKADEQFTNDGSEIDYKSRGLVIGFNYSL